MEVNFLSSCLALVIIYLGAFEVCKKCIISCLFFLQKQ